MPDRNRILVVDLLGGLGDLVMALPVIHALHRRHPDARLRVLGHAADRTILVGQDLLPDAPELAQPGGPRREHATSRGREDAAQRRGTRAVNNLQHLTREFAT